MNYVQRATHKERWMNVFLTTIFLLSFAFSVDLGHAATETTIERILADRDSYDGKEASASGIVSKIQFKTSKRGNDYTTFTLVGGSGGSVNVFIWGRPKIKEGQKAKVTGTYRKTKKVGRYTFHNEFGATDVM